MFHMPMSSPIITTILGCLAACAALGVAPPASMMLEMASAPSVSFRTPAPKSIVFSGRKYCWLASAKGGLQWAEGPIRGHDFARQQNSPKLYANFPNLAKHIPALVTVTLKPRVSAEF